jgi:hypothetical protein
VFHNVCLYTLKNIPNPTLQDEAAFNWNFLEDEPNPNVVIPERIKLVHINVAAQ